MSDSLDAHHVARYLQDHPEFFDHFAEMLAEISIPDPHNGRAISITERQMGTLRDKVRSLEGKLSQLIGFGEENDVISEKVHRLALALLETRTLAEVMGALYARMSGEFAVPHVAVRLWGLGNEGDPAAEFSPVDEALRGRAGGMGRPYCGASESQPAVAWFGLAAPGIRSVAQVPLREGGADADGGGACFGMLLLGSEDGRRFFPDMGTLYLERIGELVAAAALRAVG